MLCGDCRQHAIIRAKREVKALLDAGLQGSKKTYNGGDSLVVTHLITNPPVHCLYIAERTESLTFTHATNAPYYQNVHSANYAGKWVSTLGSQNHDYLYQYLPN